MAYKPIVSQEELDAQREAIRLQHEAAEKERLLHPDTLFTVYNPVEPEEQTEE